MTVSNAASPSSRLVKAVEALHSRLANGHRPGVESRTRELEELVELKTAFLDMTTHELRRPLGLTYGYLSMIQDGTFGNLPEALVQPVQVAAARIQEMASLVDGLAVIAHLEDRANVLDRNACCLIRLVRECVNSVETEAAAKAVKIDLHHRPLGFEVTADRERMRVAITNLLTNAIKHAPRESTVTISLHSRPPGVAVISVTDQGEGIDPAEAPRVFEKWYRSPSSRTQGLGLGLYIVNKIVELHGGRVRVESSPGQGSTFYIELSREAPAEAAAEAC
jgi:signal transduction histidine kinase